MPELPDIDVYVAILNNKLINQPLRDLRLGNAFLLRSVSPSPIDAIGDVVTELRRVGKRVAVGLDSGLWLVIHLMVAGRLHWKSEAPRLTTRNDLAAFDFDHGSLLLTEAGGKKRASLHIVAGDGGLRDLDPGGIEPLDCSYEQFRAALIARNHTLKRALTDPHIFSGIGSAYSDEILHAARLSPVLLTQRLDDEQCHALFKATVSTLGDWRRKLLVEADGEMPRKVTAFRDAMSVHGRFGQPCPDCDEPVQRIRYKTNETNYCAKCQTGSRILRDRALSRLLKTDWPGTLDEL